MSLNYLAFVIPLFILLFFIEYYYSLKKEKKYFQFDEVISNLNVGIAERMSDLFTTSIFHFFFAWVYANYAIFDIKANAVTWIFLFLATDLLWYWYHRFGHEVNLFWSAHVVHHQSEDFNFSVAARITVFQSFFRALFWSVIPLLGFPPEMITTILLVHGAYPLFTHTQAIGKLGLLEKIMVTPSHHRVHHSSNEKYLDKNYGDVLIIWDKLFGTFMKEDEKEKPIYGITDPIKSRSFLWQHFHFVLEMIVAFKRARGFHSKWKIIFGTPNYIDPVIRKELEKKLLINEPAFQRSKALTQMVATKTVVILILLFSFLLFGYYQNSFQLFIGSLYIIISVINIGAMLEQKRWLFHIEFTRLCLLTFYITLLLPYSWYAIFASIILITIVLFYRTISFNYFRILNLRNLQTK